MKRTIFSFVLILAITSTAFAGVNGNITIKESVESAVAQHPQIKAMLHNREAISRDLSSAFGRFFPSLDFSSDYGLQQYDSSTTRALNEDAHTRTASDSTLSLTQNVFDGFDRINYYEGAKARLTSAEYRLIDNVETVALDAIRAHIDVVRERKLVQLASENITDHQRVLDSIAERVAGGAASMADEMQARGRVARAETTLITYLGSLRTAEAQYYRVTGKNAGEMGDPEYTLEYMPATMSTVMEETMAGNPKIKIYKAEVEAAQRSRDVTESNLLPNVDVELSSRYTNDLDGSSTYLQDNRAMLAFSWNLFNGGSDYNNTKAADARVQETNSELQNTLDDLSRQVSVAWTEYETAVKSIEKHSEALQYSMESRDMYMMQFNVGQRSLLDVLDSINEVFSNSVLLQTAQYNRSFSLYKLVALEGQLIKNMQVAERTYDKQAK